MLQAMSAKLIAFTKETAVPISVGLLFAMVLGIWALAMRVSSWEHRLDSFEQKLGDRWTYQMERETWHEVKALNPSFNVPNVSDVKNGNPF